MPEAFKALKVFLSWSKESQDDKLASQLKKHLSILENQGRIKVWDEVEAGFEISTEEARRIKDSDIILLLISVDFFNDKDCIDDLKQAIDRYQNEEDDAFVIPVMLRTTYMESTILTKLKMLPSDKYPVVHKHWENPDEAFTRVVDEIMKLVKYANRKKEASEIVVKDDKVEIQNPSLRDYKDAVEAKNVHAIASAGDIGGIQNIVGDDKQERIIDDYLDKTSDLNSVIVDDIELSRAELLLKKAILLHKSAIRNDDAQKLEKAFQLLEQARRLEPNNIEILLEMAKVLIILTPDDPTDEEEILEHIEMMFQKPKDDETAFYLAQARYLLATSSLDHIDVDLIKAAKNTFKRLGHKQMIFDCDEMLRLANEKRQAKIPKMPNEPKPPPVPTVQPFHPIGEWNVEIHSMIPNTMYLKLFPNGTLNGKQVYMPFNGNWSFQNNYLYVQGYLSGFPFQFAVQIQYTENGVYYGMGTDGNRYVFKKIVRQQEAQRIYSSGMR